ncbi:MAG: hypothetical protein AB2689_04970 [Candidatus Thiodiazotropha taylori]
MKAKADEDKHRAFLRLVIDGGKRIDGRGKAEDVLSDENTQYEMFGRPDSILFTEARNLGFSDIKYLIDKYHIHHILDLREVPYLNFGRSNRDNFFQYLQQTSVDYLSLVSVASQTKKPSVDDLLKDDDSSEMLSNELVTWIENGPTLVLISRGREHDVLAQSFSNLLNKSKITYSEIMN